MHAAAQQQVAPRRPDVGSLFVPTRTGAAAPRMPPPSSQPLAAGQQGSAAAPAPSSTACRIASLQRQPQQEGDMGMPGLLLPPQHKTLVVPAPPSHAVAPSAVKPKLQLAWAGSGIYFFWQLGCMQYLANKFELSRVPMMGASGGGLAAVLAACDVAPEAVLESAYALSLKHNVWERPLGLMGTWGGLIEQWLHDLLPADAAERCRGQVGIVVTQLPFCNQVAIDDYADKTDLINVAMASAHVPLFLDWKVSRECRGVQCLDGSFPDFFSGENCDLLQCSGADHVMFDYWFDEYLPRGGRLDMLSLKQYKEFKRIILLGYKYAQRLDEAGEFERFDVADVAKPGSGLLQL